MRKKNKKKVSSNKRDSCLTIVYARYVRKFRILRQPWRKFVVPSANDEKR